MKIRSVIGSIIPAIFIFISADFFFSQISPEVYRKADELVNNIRDAGFSDRILWMRAAAEKYPYKDLERVGVYGTSAGAQNAAGAVLFHPEFYKVAVASCSCHDNRMDKMWWNEQWMGWPVGEEYSCRQMLLTPDWNIMKK